MEKIESNNFKNATKFILYSLIGMFMFFVSIDIGGTKTIPLDHIVTWIKKYHTMLLYMDL